MSLLERKPTDCDLSETGFDDAKHYLGETGDNEFWLLTVPSQLLSTALIISRGQPYGKQCCVEISTEYDQDTWKLSKYEWVQENGKIKRKSTFFENPGA